MLRLTARSHGEKMILIVLYVSVMGGMGDITGVMVIEANASVLQGNLFIFPHYCLCWTIPAMP